MKNFLTHHGKISAASLIKSSYGPATLLDTAEMSYHPCRGSYWTWADFWLCPSAAKIWPPDHLHSLFLPGIKIDSSVINVRFTGLFVHITRGLRFSSEMHADAFQRGIVHRHSAVSKTTPYTLSALYLLSNFCVWILNVTYTIIYMTDKRKSSILSTQQIRKKDPDMLLIVII